MASPAPWPPRSPRVGPVVGDAGVSPSPIDPAHTVLLLAHEAAEDALADAQRLAAGVLAEAGRQADALVGDATDAVAASAAQHATATLAEAISARHEDIVAMLTQVRDELRGVCDALTTSPVPEPPIGRRRSVLVGDPYAALSRSDEDFIDEVYRRIAGVASARPQGAPSSLPGDRVAALRASARRAAERAAAERNAIQAEALERQAAYRGARTRTPEPDPGERADVVVSMTERRNADAGSGSSRDVAGVSPHFAGSSLGVVDGDASGGHRRVHVERRHVTDSLDQLGVGDTGELSWRLR